MKLFFSLATAISVFMIFNAFQIENHDTAIHNKIERDTTDDYRIYDKIIREAWAFHKPNYDYPNVFKKYREAFGSVSSPLAIDVFDALRIAVEVDSVEAMFEFSAILVKKSCDHRFFERKGLEKLKNYPSEWAELTALIDEVQANPEKYWNVELKEKMETLYRKDQDIHDKYVGKTEFGNNWILVTAYQEEVKLPFLELIKEYGMVGEKELGVFIRDYDDEKELLNQAFPCIIILHIIQGGEYARFTKAEIDLYYQQGYLSSVDARYIKGNYPFPSQKEYEKTNEMIQRGAPEDSIIIQVREDWRASKRD